VAICDLKHFGVWHCVYAPYSCCRTLRGIVFYSNSKHRVYKRNVMHQKVQIQKGV